MNNLKDESIIFPSKQDEKWKYTDIAFLKKAWNTLNLKKEEIDNIEISNDLDNYIKSFFKKDTSNEIQFVFIDGIWNNYYSSNLSKIQNLGIDFSLSSSDIFQKEISQFNNNLKVDLKKIIINDNIIENAREKDHQYSISILKSINHTISIYYFFTGNLSYHHYCSYLIAPNLCAEININYIPIENFNNKYKEKIFFNNHLIDLSIKENAQLKLIQKVNGSNYQALLDTINVLIKRNSSFDHLILSKGARLYRSWIKAYLLEENASCDLSGIYHLAENHKESFFSEHHPDVFHLAPKTKSHEIYKGIVDYKNKALFDGSISINQRAYESDAKQLNKTLLLGNNARIYTSPNLQIDNDDVSCDHGASIGQLNEEELFYLISRGIDKKSAENIIKKGFLSDIFDHDKWRLNLKNDIWMKKYYQ